MSGASSRAGFAEVVSLLEGGVGAAYPAAALHCRRDGGATLSFSVGDAALSTWFDLASLTKALCTSVLCMQLHDAGRLSLEEDVLPGVPVRALLAHTSGLPAWLPLFAEAGPGPGPGPDKDLLRSPSDAGRRAMIAAAKQAPREALFSRQVYSDLGFILLGDFLEQRQGERLDAQFARLAATVGCEVAFRPLDVAASAQRAPARLCAATRRESPEREPLQGVVHDDNARAMLGVAGHAGLFGTVSGVARFAEALLAAYHDEAAAQVLGIRTETMRRFFAVPMAPPGATFGLGWDHPNPEPPPGASPPGSPPPAPSSAGRLWPRDGVGHLGFTGCSLWMDPRTRTAVILLSNRVNAATPVAAQESQAALKALRPALHDAVLRAYGAV